MLALSVPSCDEMGLRDLSLNELYAYLTKMQVITVGSGW